MTLEIAMVKKEPVIRLSRKDTRSGGPDGIALCTGEVLRTGEVGECGGGVRTEGLDLYIFTMS